MKEKWVERRKGQYRKKKIVVFCVREDNGVGQMSNLEEHIKASPPIHPSPTSPFTFHHPI